MLLTFMLTLVALSGVLAPKHLQPGGFALCILNLSLAMEMLQGWFELVNALQVDLISVKRLHEYADLPPEAGQEA